MLNFQLDELTLENIGSWPLVVRCFVVGFVVLAISLATYHFDTKGQLQRLDKGQAMEKNLKLEFERKQRLAASLPLYKKQLAEMQYSFGKMLRRLPSKTEVPGLLEDISQAGLSSGLVFKLFDPTNEVVHDFYAELPIKMAVIGDYHQLASFVSKVAALDRIVTLHDLKITPFSAEDKKNLASLQRFTGNEPLEMNITAHIYRYKEE